MNNVSLICPECKSDRCVGNPSEHLLGHYGAWFCFHCRASGNYSISFQRKVDSEEAALTEGA